MGSLSASKMRFGWVLAGAVSCDQPQTQVMSNHVSVFSGDDLLRKFWEIEELNVSCLALSIEERSIVTHFQETHCRNGAGRFVVPLPMKPDAKPLGESRSLAAFEDFSHWNVRYGPRTAFRNSVTS